VCLILIIYISAKSEGSLFLEDDTEEFNESDGARKNAREDGDNDSVRERR